MVPHTDVGFNWTGKRNRDRNGLRNLRSLLAINMNPGPIQMTRSHWPSWYPDHVASAQQLSGSCGLDCLCCWKTFWEKEKTLCPGHSASPRRARASLGAEMPWPKTFVASAMAAQCHGPCPVPWGRWEGGRAQPGRPCAPPALTLCGTSPGENSQWSQGSSRLPVLPWTPHSSATPGLSDACFWERASGRWLGRICRREPPPDIAAGLACLEQ